MISILNLIHYAYFTYEKTRPYTSIHIFKHMKTRLNNNKILISHPIHKYINNIYKCYLSLQILFTAYTVAFFYICAKQITNINSAHKSLKYIFRPLHPYL